MKKILILIIAHRGASGLYPENTLLSFEKAIEYGADMIELDVHVCKTGEVIVIHDETVDRTTNGSGRVLDMSLEQLKKLDAGNGEKIPTLEEVIAHINRRIPINIEVKGEGVVKKLVALLKNYLAKGWKPTDFLITSFDHQKVMQLKKELPQIPAGIILYSEQGSFAIDLTAFPVEYVAINQEACNKNIVDQILKAGKQPLVYTINDANRLLELLKIDGIAGIFTDFPERLVRIR